MATNVDSNRDLQSKHRAIPSEGASAPVPTLQWDGARYVAVERDSRAEATVSSSSDRGTPEPLHGSPAGSVEDLHDRVSSGLGRIWMSFGGIQAAQVLPDYWLWEAILNEQSQITGIVELGTGKGGFSLYLAAQASARGITFRTYDITAPDRSIPGFVQLDIYAWADDIGSYLREHDPVILFCDGGNKPRELKTFSQYLTPASLIVVHDWGTEMLETDVPNNVYEVYGEACDGINSMSRCFKVKDPQGA